MRKSKNSQGAIRTNNQPTVDIIPTVNVHGKEIVMTYADGRWWVAVKPICEVLNVNYDRQFKNLKEDEIMGQLYAIQHTVGADLKRREMLCIPEQFVYGWLFSIQSESPELRLYKLECYEVLYNHFHGAFSERKVVLKEKTLRQLRIEELRKKMEETPEMKELRQLEFQNKLSTSQLKTLDLEFVNNQLSLWATENEKEVSNAN